MAKALVTGGAGFMGSHLVDYLVDEMKFDVVVIDDLSGGFTENVNPKAAFVEGSILDHDLVNSLFGAHRFDYVYHLAAYAAEGLSHFIKRFNYLNNLIGSVNLINASVNHGTRCFVFTSSIAVYGTNQVPLSEDLVPMPEDSYGIAKLAVEMELKVSHELFGLNYVIFRPHNVYGERQNIGDKYRNVIGIFMNRLMQDKELIVFGDGEQRRAFTYVKDIIPCIARSVVTPSALNRTFNTGADTHCSVNELANMVTQSMGVPGRVRHVEERKEVKIAYSDHSRLREVFGEADNVPLQEGLQLMAAWAKVAGAKRSKDFASIEIQRSVPPAWLPGRQSVTVAGSTASPIRDMNSRRGTR